MQDLVRRWAPRLLLACLVAYFASAIFPFSPVEGDEQGVINGITALEQHRPNFREFSYIYSIQPGSFALIHWAHAILGGRLIAIFGILTALGAAGFILVISWLGARLCQCRPAYVALVLFSMQELLTAAWYANTCAIAASFAALALLLVARNQRLPTLLVSAGLIAVGGWIRMDSLLIAPVMLPLAYAGGRDGWSAVKNTATVAVVSALILTTLLLIAGTSPLESWQTYVAQPPAGGWPSILHLGWLSASFSGSVLILIALIVLACRREFILLACAAAGAVPAIAVYGQTFTTTKYLYYPLPFAAFLVVRLLAIGLTGDALKERFLAWAAIGLVLLEAIIGIRTSNNEYRRWMLQPAPEIARINFSPTRRPARLVWGEGEIIGTDDAFRLRTGWAYAPLVWRREKAAAAKEIALIEREAPMPGQTIVATTYLSARVTAGALLKTGFQRDLHQNISEDDASFRSEWHSPLGQTALVLINNSPNEKSLFSEYTQKPGRVLFINDRGKNIAHYFGINDRDWSCLSPTQDALLTTYIKNYPPPCTWCNKEGLPEFMSSYRLYALLASLLVCLLPASAVAEHYLTAENTPDPAALLPDPPEFGSIEATADAYSAEHVYSSRSTADLALAKDENALTIFHFSPSVGPWFVAGKFPKTEALFHEVEDEARVVTGQAKAHWHRLRPYHAFPERFPDSVEHNPETDYSYPSGHATRGMLYATLLAELIPEKRAELLRQGRQIGWLRVEGGVHFPEDVFGGRILGLSLAHAFLKTPSFQRDLAEAKAELTAAHR